MKMKRLMAMVVMAVSCLLQQGCATYLFAERDGNYFASTDDVWHKKSFPAVESIGLGMITVGVFIPIVGWVTLVPAGAIVHLAEGCVVAPAFDIVCLPVDYAINRWNESKSQAVWNRLDMDFDKTLADEAYWSEQTSDKFQCLSLWLAQVGNLDCLTSGQVSATLSCLKAQVKYQSQKQPDLDYETRCALHSIVNIIYEKSCDMESLSDLVNWIIEVKKLDMVSETELCPRVIWYDEKPEKLTDDQLNALRDAGIQTDRIKRILERRQKKNEKAKAE
jgi:hypothetical protein